MGGSPYADHWCSCERCQMHIRGVHRYHNVEMTHQDQFLVQGLRQFAHMHTGWMLFTPFCKVPLFLFATSKEEDACLGVFLHELFYHLMHQARWICLPLMCSKRCYAYPLLIVLLDTYLLWQHVQVAAFLWEDALELNLHWIAQLGKDVNIVLERGGLLNQFLVRCLRDTTTPFTMLVDMGHTVVSQIKANTQILGTQHAM